MRRGLFPADLYACFRENKGFQQTRALIRLMRAVTSRLRKTGAAAKQHAIHPCDVDLNDEVERWTTASLCGSGSIRKVPAGCVNSTLRRRLRFVTPRMILIL